MFDPKLGIKSGFADVKALWLVEGDIMPHRILEQFRANPIFRNITRNGAYVGWVKDFHGATLDGQPQRWDLNQPCYRFGLLCLASAWSRSGKWEAPVRLLVAMSSDPQRYLSPDWWVNEYSDGDWDELIAIGNRVDIPEGRPATARKDCVESFRTIASNFGQIERILDALNQGRLEPREAYDRLRRVRGTAFSNRAWRIKIPLIFRELRCQGWVGIPGSCCCVPDMRVIRAYASLGIELPTDVLEASERIYEHFGDFYDLPPFFFEPPVEGNDPDDEISYGDRKIIVGSLISPIYEEHDTPFEYSPIEGFEYFESDDLCERIVERLTNLFRSGKSIEIPLNQGRSFLANLERDGVGVTNLGSQSKVKWCAFCAAVYSMLVNGGQANKGQAVGRKAANYLGSEQLQLSSIEGTMALVCYGCLPGNSVFRRVTPVAALLSAAGIAINGRGVMKLREEFLAVDKGKTSADLA